LDDRLLKTPQGVRWLLQPATQGRVAFALKGDGWGAALRETCADRSFGRTPCRSVSSEQKAERSLRFWHTREVTARQKTPTRPLRRDAQANRDRIVAAARAAFATEGSEVPVEEIARRSGVGMGTLYRHFPAKEDLIDAVLEDAFAAFISAAEHAVAEQDAWGGFRGFLERVFTLHAENRGLKDIIATRAHGKTRAEAMRTQMRPLLRRLIERAQEQGALRADFTAEDMPLIFWAGGRVIEATAGVAPEFWRRHLGLLLDGLRAEAATPLPHPPLTRAQLNRASGRRPS
jgi:AcrR family transcriptional regulator